MSRSALLVSLALHASVLAFVGWSHLAGHAGLGSTEIGVAFSSGDAGGLVVEMEPAAEPATATPATPTYEPIISPPTPVIEVRPSPIAASDFAPPPITTTMILPQEVPPIASAKKTRSKSRAMTSSGKAASLSSNASSSGAGGGGAVGAGTGGGGPGYIPPQFLMRYKPPYPDQARAMRLEGIVLLLVSVDAAGHVTDARLSHSCGHEVLDRAALSAVRSWRFIPARQANQPISATVEVPIRFHLSA